MRLGAQVYSIRDRIQTPEGYFTAMVELKKMGYDTVQHAGAPLGDPYLLRDLTQQAGLQQVCPNVDKGPILEDVAKVVETLRILGCDSIMLPYITPDAFNSLASYQAAWKELEMPLEKLQEAGITPVYHNHDFDVAKMSGWDGSWVEWLLEHKPGWEFLLDVCWAEYAHRDVSTLFDTLGKRINCVHFKDYTGGMNERHVPVFCACGQGVVQLETYKDNVQTLHIKDVIVEQDNALNYPDPMGQMKQSAEFLHSIF